MTVLDWIADKFGYQRKFRKITWPQTFIPYSVMKEREDDNCLPPGYIFPHFPTQKVNVKFVIDEPYTPPPFIMDQSIEEK